MDSTFDASSGASPRTTKENADKTFSPIPASSSRTMTRDRQKTMVVESPLIAEIKGAFATTKENPDAERIAELERTVLSCVQRLENDSNKRIRAAEQQHSTNFTVAKDMAEEYNAMCEELLTRVESGGLSIGGGNCGGNCASAAKLRVDCDSLQNQVDNQYADYIKLHDVYLKIRKAVDLQKEEYANLEAILHKERHSKEDMRGRFLRLKETATSQLEKASADVSRMEQEHNEKTIGLRMKVKQLTTAIAMKDQELELKKTELDQLRDICNTLMNEVQPISDVDSERE